MVLLLKLLNFRSVISFHMMILLNEFGAIGDGRMWVSYVAFSCKENVTKDTSEYCFSIRN
jgi:hypothetical protein